MGENELRWQLRQLPAEIDPPRDLWPGIAARIAAMSHEQAWFGRGECECLISLYAQGRVRGAAQQLP